MARGFIFIELLTVLLLISVLAAVAIPAYSDYQLRAQVSEGIALVMPVQKAVGDYYAYHGRFPVNNREANVHEPEQFGGRYVSQITVLEGRILLTFRGDLAGEVLSFQSRVVADNSLGMLVWQCGQDEKTTLGSGQLPSSCKKR